MGRSEWEWLRWWMYRAELTRTTRGDRRCMACAADIDDTAPGFVIRPTDWDTTATDSLDAVEEIMGLEDRLGFQFTDAECDEPGRLADICARCETRYRDVLLWRAPII